MAAKLSRRAQQVLDMTAISIRFRHGLVRDRYTGREQFQWSLESGGKRISGFGAATYHELVKAGYTFRREVSGFSGIATYYHLDRS